VGAVAVSGEQAVQPKQTTTYSLTASGPGGTATSSATVNVNNSLQASLEISPTEVHYRRVGDQVVEQGNASLSWSAANASSISIDPLGSVSTSGNRTIQASPQKMDPGNIDETVTYTLRTTNTCGGAETRTVRLHITGSNEPAATNETESRLALHSIWGHM
jgi:hypothetical protein